MTKRLLKQSAYTEMFNNRVYRS